MYYALKRMSLIKMDSQLVTGPANHFDLVWVVQERFSEFPIFYLDVTANYFEL